MPELAVHEVGTVEERTPKTGGRRRGHFFTDIAAHIWGGGYVGTVGTFNSAPTQTAGAQRRPIATGTTSIIWEASDLDAFPHLSPTFSAEVGVKLWGGNVVLALPSYEPAREADLVYWADPAGGGRAMWLIEAKFTATESVEHTPAWRRIFDAYISQELEVGKLRQGPPRDVHAELRLLSDWTRLPVEQLGELVGAARRTIYNWFAGKPIRDDGQARILRLHDLLAPVAETRDPSLVRSWLLRGDPSPSTLAAEGRWREFERLAAAEVRPLQPMKEVGEQVEAELAHVDSPEVLRATLLAFASPPAGETKLRREWQPREITGVTPEDAEDAE